MLSNNRKKITLMNPVRVNHQMFKHVKETKEEETQSYNDYLSENFTDLADSWLDSNSSTWDGVPFETQRRFDSDLKKNIAEMYIKTRLFFMKQFGKTKHSDEQFFEMVKGSMKELDEFSHDEQSKMQKELNVLFETKQKAVYKNIVKTLEVKDAENKLYNEGLRQYQDEQDIINFIMKTEAGLCLLEVEHFKFEIPEDVRTKMMEADKLKVFDNFYVLFTDPEYDKTKVKHTIKKEKDPILFGVIKNSTKLYYIGDWISDYCKLTYEVLLQTNKDHKLTYQK